MTEVSTARAASAGFIVTPDKRWLLPPTPTSDFVGAASAARSAELGSDADAMLLLHKISDIRSPAVLLARTRRQSYDEALAAPLRAVARPRVRDRIQEYLGHRERMLATNAAIKDTERQPYVEQRLST